MSLVIIRDFNDSVACIGSYVLDGVTYHTMENAQKLIPAGRYWCEKDMYYGGDGVGGKTDYPCFELRDVPGRTEIKIHKANYPHQLLGCIAPGMARDEAKPAVWSSGTAFNILMQHFTESFYLDIVDNF